MTKRWIPASIVALALTPGCIIQDNSCVAEGAQIATPQGLRPIEALEVGDLVWAVDPNSGERHSTRVTAIRTATRECLSLQLGSTSLVCTPDHPIYVPATDTYEPAVSYLERKADTILRVDERGTEVLAVQSVRTDAGMHRVFDITVESPLHNFVANGVLVHNKSPGCDIDGPSDDPNSCNYTSSVDTGDGDETDTDTGTGTGTDGGSESGATTEATEGSEGDSTGSATESSGTESGSGSGSESGTTTA